MLHFKRCIGKESVLFHRGMVLTHALLFTSPASSPHCTLRRIFYSYWKRPQTTGVIRYMHTLLAAAGCWPSKSRACISLVTDRCDSKPCPSDRKALLVASVFESGSCPHGTLLLRPSLETENASKGGERVSVQGYHSSDEIFGRPSARGARRVVPDALPLGALAVAPPPPAASALP